MNISGRQVSAARALLNWTAARLAEEAGIGLATVKRIEAGDAVRSTTNAALKTALESGGVVFLDAGQPSGKAGEGVRLAC